MLTNKYPKSASNPIANHVMESPGDDGNDDDGVDVEDKMTKWRNIKKPWEKLLQLLKKR